MRLVFVNHCAPTLRHVCAVRVTRFAEAAARAGHEVVLLAETEPGQPGHSPADVALRLAAWNRSAPLVLAVDPVGYPLVVRAREGRLPGGVRQGVLAASYWLHGGVFPDFSRTGAALAAEIGRKFRPQAVWGSFGNTGVWSLAQSVARSARCPWVADVKDPPGAFLPKGVRGAVRLRFTDAAAFTALSQGHAEDALAVLGRAATVVRSGIDDEFLTPPSPPSGMRIQVQGALYGDDHLHALIHGIGQWLTTVPDSHGVVVAYAGNEAARFRKAAKGLPCRVESRTYMPLPQLRAAMAQASVLAYVRAPRALFQHKLYELAAMDRPILCVPAESAEARDEAARLGVSLIEAETADGVAQALAQAGSCRADRSVLAGLTWDAQSKVLLDVLEGAA